MLKLKIMLTAKKEYKQYGSKYINKVIVWEKLPFIKKQLTECPVAHEKIIIKEHQAHEIFNKIKIIQSDYGKIISDCAAELKKIEESIKYQEERIGLAESELKTKNDQIQAFNNNKVLSTGENIFQIRERAENLSKHIAALEAEKQELYKKKEEAKSNLKKNLDTKYKELQKEYTSFSARIETIAAKIKRKILEKRNCAVLYTDYFWNCYIKQYIKKKKNEGLKKNDIEIPMKPKLNTEPFKLATELFIDEKKEINDFRNKYQIEYTI